MITAVVGLLTLFSIIGAAASVTMFMDEMSPYWLRVRVAATALLLVSVGALILAVNLQGSVSP